MKIRILKTNRKVPYSDYDIMLSSSGNVYSDYKGFIVRDITPVKKSEMQLLVANSIEPPYFGSAWQTPINWSEPKPTFIERITNKLRRK